MSEQTASEHTHIRPQTPPPGTLSFNNTRATGVFPVFEVSDGATSNENRDTEAVANTDTDLQLPVTNNQVTSLTTTIFESNSDDENLGFVAVEFEDTPSSQISATLILGPATNLDSAKDEDCAMLVYRTDPSPDGPIVTLLGASCSYVAPPTS